MYVCVCVFVSVCARVYMCVRARACVGGWLFSGDIRAMPYLVRKIYLPVVTGLSDDRGSRPYAHG
jgi:hypothetical protein